MLSLLEVFLPPDKFQIILEKIKPKLKKDADLNSLYEDLAKIKISALIEGIDELENGPTISKIIKLLHGLAYDIETLLERQSRIEKLYPVLIEPETGQRLKTTPDWLSKFTDKINFEELKKIAEELRILEKSANEATSGGKKPRLSARPYYIRKLIEIYDKHAIDKAVVKKHKQTEFSDFVIVFLEHGGTVLKMRQIMLSALYDEFQKIKSEE